MAERNMPDLETGNEAEQGSSEETLEDVTNVSTKPFSNIASCQLLTQKTLGDWKNVGQVTEIVLLPDGQAVLCDSSGEQLKILGKDMETKLNLFMKRPFNSRPSLILFMAMALFDRKGVAVAMSCTWQRTEEDHEEMTFINIVSVSPKVKLRPQIKRKYQCEKITCFNNKIYCYSPNLNISTICCPGIEILSQTGDVLKTIQLFDMVSRFCPSKDGNIIYFGSRFLGNRPATFFKCVTDDNTEVFHYPTTLLEPKYAVSDIQGNIIILNSSGHIVLLNPDGSRKRVLLDKTDIGVQNITSMCYSDENKTLLLAAICDWHPQLLLYQLQ